MATQLAVPAVGYFPPEEEKFPHGEIDSLVYIVFVGYKHDWRVASLWLSQAAALKASRKFKQRPTRIVSVLVPGLIRTAACKLRRTA